MPQTLDLNKLDHWLSSDDSPDDCFMLSDLDGFLHGVACGPVPVRTEKWLNAAFGGQLHKVPDWVLEAVTGWLEGIKAKLQQEPQIIEPVFWQAPEGYLIAMDWCEGFMEAIKLCPKEWLRLQESGTDGRLMTPILVHILDDKGNSVLGIAQEDLDAAIDEAAERLPQTVVDIYNYWRG